MTEPDPYLCDEFTCSVCGEKAEYECQQCDLFFCHFDTTTKQGKSYHYCPKCGGRLYSAYETHKRFIGSKRAQQKMVATGRGHRPIKKKGKIVDKGKPLKW